MKYRGLMHLLIPTNELIEECEPSENLLQIVGTTTKEMVEMFISSWNSYNSVSSQVQDIFSMGDGTSLAPVQARLLVADLIFDSYERNRESGQAIPSTETRKAIEEIMMAIWRQIFTYILEVLESIGVDEERREALTFVRWAGSDIIIAVPVPLHRF